MIELATNGRQDFNVVLLPLERRVDMGSGDALRRLRGTTANLTLSVMRIEGGITLSVTIDASADDGTPWKTVGRFDTRSDTGSQTITVPTEGVYLRASWWIQPKTAGDRAAAKFQLIGTL